MRKLIFTRTRPLGGLLCLVLPAALSGIAFAKPKPWTEEEKRAVEATENWVKRVPTVTKNIEDYTWDRYAGEVPEWYQDAKFGIYAHWGPYNIGMEKSGFSGSNNSWYPKYIFAKGHPYNKHHEALFGPIKEIGYSAYFPKFTAPKFDPAEWADLIAGAGAKFAGPVAMHHDGFAMWDSEVVPWDGMMCGAKRDFAGELIHEYRRRGMKIMSSFHHAFNVVGRYYGGRVNRPDDGPVVFESELSDPAFAKLYGKFETQAEAENYWLAVLKEYITKYEPDQLWFDGGLKRLSEESLFEMTRFYYDFCKKRGIEGVISQKHDQVPRRVSVLDFERGGAPEIFPRTWQTDDSPGPWMYIDAMTFKGADWVIPLLIDIVSKNGTLLLNIAPLADGSIHPEQKKMLRETGDWLRSNGEAIYATRPWKVHYQGGEPHFYDKGKAFTKTYAKYGDDDYRFTRSKDGTKLYIFAMGGAKDSITIESLKFAELGKEHSVKLLGTSKVLPVGRDQAGSVVVPASELIKHHSKSLRGPLVFCIDGLKPVK